MIAARLRRAGGVLITGPRAVGKTTTALAFARSEVRLDQDRAALLAARTDPRLVLDGEFPRPLDEYQLVDGLWEAVQGRIDERRLRGAYLLTGSATPDPELRLHSGAGRIAVVAMRTMSIFERGLSSGVVSTEKLLQGQTPGATSDRISVPDALEAVATGGWPDQLDPAPRDALEAVRDYLEIVVHSDLEEATGVRRNPGGVIRLLCSYARIVATGSVLFCRDNKGLEVDAAKSPMDAGSVQKSSSGHPASRPEPVRFWPCGKSSHPRSVSEAVPWWW